MADDRPAPWLWPALDHARAAAAEFVPLTPGCGDGPRGAGGPRDRDAPPQGQEAQSVLEAAHAQAEEIRRQVREEATREARERVQALLGEVVAGQAAAFERARDELLQQVRAASEERMARLERELAGLVGQMTAKVVARKVEADDTVVLDVVRGTLSRAAGASRVTVRVAAADDATVRRAQAELLSAVGGVEELTIVADDGIGRGGCVVVTERGHFDARIETQLEALDEEIGRVLGGEGAGADDGAAA